MGTSFSAEPLAKARWMAAVMSAWGSVGTRARARVAVALGLGLALGEG